MEFQHPWAIPAPPTEACVGYGPFISPTINSLNPCFWALVVLVASVAAGLACVGQTARLAWWTFPTLRTAPHPTPLHLAKLALAGLYALLQLVLAYDLRVAGSQPFLQLAYAAWAAASASTLPLLRLERQASLVPSGALLVYWTGQIPLLAGLLLQQTLGTVPPLPRSPEFAPLLLALAVQATAVLHLELRCWTPEPELQALYTACDMPTNVPDMFSRLTFSWMNPLIAESHRKQTLDEDDIPSLPDIVDTRYSFATLRRHWNAQLLARGCDASLVVAIVRSFGRLAALATAYNFAESVISFGEPQLLRLLVRFFSHDRDTYPLVYGLALALGMFVVSVLETTLHNQYFIKTFEAGLAVRSSLMALVYEKALSVSPAERLHRTTGDIINHMSVDVNRVDSLSEYLQSLVTTPTKLVIALVCLFRMLGVATWGGVAVLLVILPTNTLLVRSLRSLHKTQMRYKDERTSIMSEILTTIKSIKLYAWERPMLAKLADARNNRELRNLRRIGCLSAVTNFAWQCIPFFVSSVSFSVYALVSRDPLTPDIVFPALSLFNLLSDPIFEIPALITSMIECGLALSRLSSFLHAGEIDVDQVQRLPRRSSLGDEAVAVANSTFLWTAPPPAPADLGQQEAAIDAAAQVALRDVAFSAKKGQLACVIGRVGAGKSTLLQAILGELAVVPANSLALPTTTLHGSVAYCAQVPFIMNATVKENILFGAQCDDAFYQQTLAACQLLPDLAVLPDGDATLVGEKGISLSGGQKARVSLARAVYSRADVYLLDDVLSAVDAHVSQRLVDEVLGCRGLLRTKTRVLATNSIAVLPQADHIALIRGQTIAEQGSFGSLMAARSGVYELVAEFGRPDDTDSVRSLTQDPDSSSVTSLETDSEPADHAAKPQRQLVRSASHETLRQPAREPISTPIHVLHQDDPRRRTALKKEAKSRGKVQWSVYLEYARACGLGGVAVLLVLMVCVVSLSFLANYWLKLWSESNLRNGTNSHPVWFITVYAALSVGSSLMQLLKALSMWLLCGIRGARRLHDRMAHSVVGAPMEFFETTPLGRVTNRFANDVNKVDETLARMFTSIGDALVRIVFTLGVIGFNMPLFLVFMAAISGVYYYYQVYYLAVSRELKRVSNNARSPILSHLQETIHGTDTIRAYGQLHKFSVLNVCNINHYNKFLYSVRSVNRWLSMRLQFLGSVILLVTCCLVLASAASAHPFSAGMVGLLMSYALRVTNSFNFIVRRSVEVESNLVCVERMLEYINMPQEEDSQRAQQLAAPPPGWPAQGAISFQDFSARYRQNLDPVLRHISLELRSCEKVGVVGRTGAGKSTLALALFRLIEPCTGHIEIDGVNTSELRLFDLRHSLSIIPQDSQAIAGSVRMNLDPLGQYSDAQLWEVLELAHLREHVLQMASGEPDGQSGLEARVAEGGSNFSVGQRQLLCLARALLNPSRVLLLDEATAAVDVQTDRIVQETIRSAFRDRTIVTIAHRLNTVMDSDRILVLDNGEVKELDSPDTLLKNKDSFFYKLCQSSSGAA